MMKRFSICLALALALALGMSSSAQAGNHVFVAYLGGDQERPTPNTSGAFGFGIFILDDEALTLNWAISYGALEGGRVSGAHFHRGGVEMAGPIIKDYTSLGLSSPDGFVQATWSSGDATQPLTASDALLMFEFGIYFNIHTTPTYPGGEIRGVMAYFFSY